MTSDEPVGLTVEVPAGGFNKDDTKWMFKERLLHGIIQSRTSRFTMEVEVPGLGVRSHRSANDGDGGSDGG